MMKPMSSSDEWLEAKDNVAKDKVVNNPTNKTTNASKNKTNKNQGQQKVFLFFCLALLFLGFHFRSFVKVHDFLVHADALDHDEVFARPHGVVERQELVHSEDEHVQQQQQNSQKQQQASQNNQQLQSQLRIPNQPSKQTNSLANDNIDKTPEQLEKDFYNHHYQQMSNLVNDTSFMVWDTRDEVNPFGPLWKHFGDHVYKANGITHPNLTASPYIFWGSICFAALEFQKYRQEHPNAKIPHVLFFRMNENWGGFSEAVPGKTAEWIRDLVGNEWKKMKCQNSTIWDYINHPETLVAITTQFQIFDHPKVHSLPLGIKSIGQAEFLLERLKDHHQEPRTQLLMVNSKPRPMRLAAINAVIDNFHGTVQNTFGKGADAHEAYYQEMQRSKFILSPGGLGFDCYRHWEALYMGTIPVLETLNRTDGWFRTFNDLPVAWIDSYEHLTPAFLEQEYQRIIAKWQTYNFSKLTRQWWVGFIQSHVPPELRHSE